MGPLKTRLSSLSPPYYLGIDIGSISINTVILDEKGQIHYERYDYCEGRPFEQLKQILDEVLEALPDKQPSNLAFTGSGGKLASEILGGIYINEVISQSAAVSHLHPEVRISYSRGSRLHRLLPWMHGARE
ncbi:MAG TPA: hypothetical protein ENI20_09820 [Bacteroides sp.]|nr:hypothetical protein [Bacteroides sp.]